jgi:hypothetical protein
MSVSGSKPKRWHFQNMPAVPPTTDICRGERHVGFVPTRDLGGTPREDFSGSAGICLVEFRDDNLLHLHHGLHGAVGLFAIGIA